MGNCVPKNGGEKKSTLEVLKNSVRFLRGGQFIVDEEASRKPGEVSAEAVQWFVERDQRTLAQSTSFVPWVIQRGIKIGTVSESTDSVVVYRGDGAVVFCDASGFTKLTEYLAQKSNGAELLSTVLNQFFTPLIEIISAYRGDIIKFSGDALTILFLAEPDETSGSEYDLPCGSGWARCSGHSDIELAVLRAVACCIEIHKRLDNFDTGIPDRTLSFHIGVGCGSCVVLHLGGETAPEDPKTRRFEYVICGEPLEQIAHACHYAEVYETVLSPQAWELVKDTVIEGPPIDEDPAYKKLAGLVTSKHTYATIRAAALAKDTRQERYSLKLHEMNVARRYIPGAVYQQMENGTLEYVNEIRNVSVFFICVAGLDVSTPQGALTAQDLMSSVQQACFEQEGQVNKFLVDDKGLLFLCVFGTPPMVHTDDPLRAIFACFSIIQSLKRLGLSGNFGLSTGRVFCGVVGSSARQEYTTLGDSVNLAARFMQLGKSNVVMVDQATYDQTKADLDYTVLEPVRLKGKANPMPVFQPHLKMLMGSVGGLKQPAVESERPVGTDAFRRAGSSVDMTTRPVMRSSGSSADIGIGSSPASPKRSLQRRKSTRMGELISVAPTSRKSVSEVASPSKMGTVFDPLVECGQWRELKVTKRILDETGLIKTGGTIVFGGQSGLGKDQLCQIVISTASRISPDIVTVYATDQGQPRDRARPVIELIETCLSVACENELDGDKLDQLSELIGVSLDEIREGAMVNEETGLIEIPELNAYLGPNGAESAVMSAPSPLPNAAVITIGDDALSPSRGRITQGWGGRDGGSNYVPFEDQFLNYCEALIVKILQDRPMVLVMKSSRGTSLFNVVNNPTFWKLVERMARISHDESNPHPLTVVLLCRRVEDAEGMLPTEAHSIDLQPLTRNCIEEYVSKILRLEVEGANSIPHELIDFVEDLTQGNPLYIMETLEQLMIRKFITRSVQGYVSVNATDLQGEVSVADWSHTSMVGRVICQLEALPPQEAAIVKMGTVFQGPFSVLDVAASLKSPYTNARRFDNYRMYRTCARLVKLGIIAEIPHLRQAESESNEVPVNDMSRFPKDTDEGFINCMNKIPMFILDNFLIRKVAGGMILQQQALKVKRQAMMYRVVFKDVPQRLENHRKRVASLHMPYYNLVKL